MSLLPLIFTTSSITVFSNATTEPPTRLGTSGLAPIMTGPTRPPCEFANNAIAANMTLDESLLDVLYSTLAGLFWGEHKAYVVGNILRAIRLLTLLTVFIFQIRSDTIQQKLVTLQPVP